MSPHSQNSVAKEWMYGCTWIYIWWIGDPVNMKYIMAYGSTPYVGMTLKKNDGHIESCKWHARNICVRSVNVLHEPHQALSSGSMGDKTINFAGKHRKSTDRQVAKTGKSSIFWLSSFPHHDSTITAEAILTIQTRKNSINHWVLYPVLIVILELEQFFSDSQALRC